MIFCEFKKHTAYITLNSPETGNTVNQENLTKIKQYVEEANNNDSIRLILLQGSHGIFCKGIDFSIILKSEKPENFTLPYMETILAIRNSKKPVICLVDGEVLAGGIGLVCASDIVLCTPQSSFGLSEVYFGLIPAYVFPVLLERIPFKKARYMALSSRKIPAAEALMSGLVDEIIPIENMKKAVKEYQQRIFFSSPDAMELVKSYSDTLLAKNLKKSLLKARKQLEALLHDTKKTDAIKKYLEGEALPWSLSHKKEEQ